MVELPAFSHEVLVYMDIDINIKYIYIYIYIYKTEISETITIFHASTIFK